ncbi:glycoside hydrolase family 140 protein [Pedobacter nyackensis]|uniref:Putative collagen-binding domain of a collagenase n=1 Tax=Pedobacter nyackensis TaxID=475255 RepID=A0A1W2E1A5_9SPHI|nr:glycoside hydrolase family 140 protein [Pedobacter nyackensis]SMD03519.1 Putative collagen-binding domain of a collagenase [Pedobacter nyackensis]
MYQRIVLFAFISLALFGCTSNKKPDALKKGLHISENGRYFTEDGKPFFWLGDTGWLLFNKTTREQADQFLEDRRQKGFNVIQAMVLHTVPSVNIYGDSSLVNGDIAKPAVTEGNSFADSTQYDFWDHIDYIVDKAKEKGIYMALVPVWGTNVKNKKVTPAQAKSYAEFLTNRYKDKSNIIWLNGGDIKGSEVKEVWEVIGATLRANDPNHLITFHPRGRTGSSEWFHDAKWLDFNMVQSGHRRYDQDTSAKEQWHYGEDNWKYIEKDYNLKPVKPTIDGEPSYEGIPQGLHDVKQPRWNDADVRRYGYWSVFAGAFGYTYGDNSVMQFYKAGSKGAAYGATKSWQDALNDPGAGQMIHLKNLMLSRVPADQTAASTQADNGYFDRVPDQSVIVGAAGGDNEKYNRLLATRGKDYLFVYTYNGRNIPLKMGVIEGDQVKASWFSPRDGKTTAIGNIDNKGTHDFDPPGEVKDGNDWVLIIDKI